MEEQKYVEKQTAETLQDTHETNSVLTKKDLNKAYWRLSLWGETSLNFERMQSIGYCNAMVPILKKLYPEKEDLAKALKRHLQFFNTQLNWGNLILGPTIAMEEEKAKKGEIIADELITSFKTGMMGPVAALGDSIDFATIGTLVTAFAASTASEGSSLAVLIIAVWCILHEVQGFLMFKFGYGAGRKSLKTIMKSGLLNDFLMGANILGMFMMGVLTSSLVALTTVFKVGSFDLQATLNSIIPGILPLSVLFIVYFLIHKKQISTAKIVIFIILFGILGSLIGLF